MVQNSIIDTGKTMYFHFNSIFNLITSKSFILSITKESEYEISFWILAHFSFIDVSYLKFSIKSIQEMCWCLQTKSYLWTWIRKENMARFKLRFRLLKDSQVNCMNLLWSTGQEPRTPFPSWVPKSLGYRLLLPLVFFLRPNESWIIFCTMRELQW